MGCCETRLVPEGVMDLQYRYYSSNGPRENLKSLTKPEESLKVFKKPNNNIDIPQTREVRVPTAEIPIEIIKTRKRLSLTVFESKYLTEGTVLTITPGGLEGSERMTKDGLVLFGTKNEEIINDFNFPEEDAMGKRHFEIKYDIGRDVYKIKNLFGSGLFVKIGSKLLIRNNSIFSFSTTHIIVKIMLDNKHSDSGNEETDGEVINSSITFKVIHGINENQQYTFHSKKTNCIKLGRMQISGVDIAFGEESTSRVQCTIFYESNNWYIVDGDGDKSSLNGTWFLADEYMDIHEDMIFRAGTTSFISHLFDPLN